MKRHLESVKHFYAKQNEWAGVYNGDVTGIHRKNATIVQRMAGGGTGCILDLGAGGGQNAAALADLGYSVVAVEIVPSEVQHARRLASGRKGRMDVVWGDFYDLDFHERFDVVCYWDGFGIGTDSDHRRLLKLIAGWLRTTGFALIEIYSPWYWARAAGREMRFGEVRRRYGFDAKERRMLDRWWRDGAEDQAVSQSLRCYSPEELRSLLEGTGLILKGVEPRGAFDFDRKRFIEDVPLERCMQYLAHLRPTPTPAG